MKKVTFCLVCGATPPVEAKRCGECGAPLREKKKGPRIRLPQFGRPAPLALLVALAIAAVVVAVVTFLLTL